MAKKDEAACWGYNTLPILTSRNIIALFKMHVGGNRLSMLSKTACGSRVTMRDRTPTKMRGMPS